MSPRAGRESQQPRSQLFTPPKPSVSHRGRLPRPHSRPAELPSRSPDHVGEDGELHGAVDQPDFAAADQHDAGGVVLEEEAAHSPAARSHGGGRRGRAAEQQHRRAAQTHTRTPGSGSRDSPAALPQPRGSWRSDRALPPFSARPIAAPWLAGAPGQVRLGNRGVTLVLKSGQELEWAVLRGWEGGVTVRRGAQEPSEGCGWWGMAGLGLGGLILVIFIVFSNFYDSVTLPKGKRVRTGMR